MADRSYTHDTKTQTTQKYTVDRYNKTQTDKSRGADSVGRQAMS